MQSTEISNLSLLFIIVFVMVPVSLSYLFSLNLSKTVIWSSVRGVAQLFLIGYVLTFLFNLPNWQGIGLWVSVMILVATLNASRKAKGIPRVRLIVFVVIALIEVSIISLWLLFGYIPFTVEKVIPVSGMIIGNSMVAIGLALERLLSQFREEKGRILAALSLGATPRQASIHIIRKTLRAAMIPNIDGLKTIGLVQLPGMMTGLILGGVSPMDAVRYQIVISLSIFVSVAVSAMFVTIILYQAFYNDKMQLMELNT
ncbi:ABC transporter permease [Pseudalkalibacillus berkeleyi]|uniref:Iron export ABC transporter permease subunit FetB n=1 Tax=Pseudalkalibacillus berkeleyi TaxID=1069813 RepID=A0ABS9H1D8_9BACL|nr:iron export ABC transporter permease subunit FetB [Pseudalkalibacillus berkeleyi]MCF6137896.1 iron export ABC transporter permease subunit FetB [Pseudalkalibacillus berkeleyi]